MHAIRTWGPPPPTDRERDEMAGRDAWVSLSGGIDSTAAAHYVRAHWPGTRMVALYHDSGCELPGVRATVERVVQCLDMDLVVTDMYPPMDDLMRDRGWPHHVGPWCRPALLRAAECVPLDAVYVYGGTRAQTGGTGAQRARARRRAPMDPHACVGGARYYEPVRDLPRSSAADILASDGVPVWDGYARGYPRTCCWCCPGGRASHYIALRREAPHLWQQWLDLEAALGPGTWHGRSVLASRGIRGRAMTATDLIASRRSRRAMPPHPCLVTAQ